MAETRRRGELRLEGRNLTRGRKGEPKEGPKLKMEGGRNKRRGGPKLGWRKSIEGGRNKEERNFTR